jgi:hypothetical protein
MPAFTRPGSLSMAGRRLLIPFIDGQLFPGKTGHCCFNIIAV